MSTRLFISLLAAVALALPVGIKAQTGSLQPYLTWRATTYVPSFYDRKALPVSKSDIIVAIDVIAGGRPADLSAETVYWHLNDRFVSGGPGATRISLTAPDIAGRGVMEVRASLPAYRGGIAKTIRIPVVSPEAGIEAPIPGRRARTSPFDLRGNAFFFNVSDTSELSFAWRVNGKEPATYADPERLQVNLAPTVTPGTTIPVSLKVTNPYGNFEFAASQTVITYNP